MWNLVHIICIWQRFCQMTRSGSERLRKSFPSHLWSIRIVGRFCVCLWKWIRSIKYTVNVFGLWKNSFMMKSRIASGSIYRRLNVTGKRVLLWKSSECLKFGFFCLQSNINWWQENWRFTLQILQVRWKFLTNSYMRFLSVLIRCIRNRWYWRRSVLFWSKETVWKAVIFSGMKKRWKQSLRLLSFMNIIWLRLFRRIFTKRFRDRYICILCTEIHWITINAHFYIQTWSHMKMKAARFTLITETRWKRLHGISLTGEMLTNSFVSFINGL